VYVYYLFLCPKNRDVNEDQADTEIDKPSELGKRACIFHASSAAAGMFSGYLQAAVYTGLNGTLGHAGWQWLFIMDGLISLPIALLGFFLIPDLPENTRAFYLTAEDATLARQRMDDVGRAPRGRLGWGVLRRVFGRWHVWGLTVLYVVFINTGSSSSVNPLALWLKDGGWPIPLIVSLFSLVILLLLTKGNRTSSPPAKAQCSSSPQSVSQF